MSRFVLWVLVVFCAAVCVFDIYLTVATSDELLALESNPLAAWLIRCEHVPVHVAFGGVTRRVTYPRVDVSGLVAVKSAGLATAVLLFEALIRGASPRITTTVVVAVSACQALLLFWLLS